MLNSHFYYDLNMKAITIAPSLLASDFANLATEIRMLNESEAEWLHLDIMDGRFVPNISFGIPVVEAIRKHTTKHLDCHLMIVEPEKYLEEFKKAGANSISVHYEACPHLHRVVQQIKALDCLAGVALNPHTPVEVLSEILFDLDFVLIMSVNPGFGGQSFIENTYSKIQKLRKMADELQPNLEIQVDGGVNGKNIKKLVEMGATNLVAGSFVFKSDNPKNTISELKNCN